MTLEQYRIRHSMLIEQYQWIEFDLEGLYAFISEKPFSRALSEIEKDTIGGVAREIRFIEGQRDITVFSEAEYRQLDELRRRRNFWSHVCYTEVYDRKTGTPHNASELEEDLVAAETFLTRLRQIKDMFAAQYRDNY